MKHNIYLVGRIISEWLALVRNAKTCLMKQVKILTYRSQTLVQRACLQWLIHFKYRRELKIACLKKLNFRCIKMFVLHFRVWIEFFRRKRRNQSCSARYGNKSAAVVLQSLLQGWNHQARVAIRVRMTVKRALSRLVTLSLFSVLDIWRARTRKQRINSTCKSRIGLRRITTITQRIMNSWNIVAKRRCRSKIIFIRAVFLRGNGEMLRWFGVWNEFFQRQQRYNGLAAKLKILARRRSVNNAFMTWLKHHHSRCNFFALLLQLRRKMAIRLLVMSFKILRCYFNMKWRLGSTFLSIARKRMHRYSKRTFSNWCFNVSAVKKCKRSVILVILRKAQNIFRICYDGWRIHYRQKRSLCSIQSKIQARRILFCLSSTATDWKTMSSRTVCVQRKLELAVKRRSTRSTRGLLHLWADNVQDCRKESSIVFRTLGRIRAMTTLSLFDLWKSNSKINTQYRWRSSQIRTRKLFGLLEQTMHAWKAKSFRRRRVLRLLWTFKRSRALRGMSLCVAAFAVCATTMATSQRVLN